MLKDVAKAVLPRPVIDGLNIMRAQIPRKLSRIEGKRYLRNFAALPCVRPHHLPDTDIRPWLDRPGADAAVDARTDLTAQQREQLKHFSREGYLIIDKLFSDAEIDKLWAAFDKAADEGRLQRDILPGEVHPDRPVDPHLSVPEVDKFMNEPRILAWMDLLLGETTRPFQSIVSFRGTDQLAHSDHVHMTTHPVGYLTAVWVALEDIHPDAGPLEYYPRSHKLPYKFCKDVGIADGENAVADGYKLYHEKYEPFIQQMIRDEGLERQLFHAKKGDALIWHANLLHGGSPRRDKSMTRRAIVNHYFATDAFCYHDLSATPARKF